MGTLGISFPQRATSKALSSRLFPSPLEAGKISEHVLWEDDGCKRWERGDPEDGTLGLVHARQLFYHREAQPGYQPSYRIFNLRLRKDSRFWRPSHSTPAGLAFHDSG